LVSFECEKCRVPLEIEAEHVGKQRKCPECRSGIVIPCPSTHPASGTASSNPTVPVNMRLPGGAGFQANVSRSDAGKLAFTFLGALLAIVGIFFGIKWNRRA
jgi:hypothetical protein